LTIESDLREGASDTVGNKAVFALKPGQRSERVGVESSVWPPFEKMQFREHALEPEDPATFLALLH
jgi:hypothetical protein